MDLFLDGWDDVDESGFTGDYGWPLGDHESTITRAAFKTGEKNGNTWAALALDVTTPEHGERKNIYVFLPTAATWAKFSDGAKRAVKAEWAAIGLRPQQADDEAARASIIDRKVLVRVEMDNRDKKVYRFRQVQGQGSPLPTQEQREQQSVASPSVTL